MVVSAEIALPSPASAVISPSRAARSTAALGHAVVCLSRLAPEPRRVAMANGHFCYRLAGIREDDCPERPGRRAVLGPGQG
jgi:hypothetical protein